MPKVSEQHLDARREQIVDAAVACFAREGFHRTTMEEISREAGLSQGAIYRYFPGKEQIIEAIAAERHAREAAFTADATASGEGAEALRAMGRAFFSSLADPDERARRRLGVQVWAEALRNPAIHELVNRGVRRPLEAMAEMARQAQRRGELSSDIDPEGLARMLVALFQGFVLQQAWDPRADVATYLETVEAVINAVLREQVAE